MTTPYRLRTSTPATAVALALMILTAVACGGDKKAPTIAAPEGFQVASNDKEGFALAVPSDWTVIPLAVNPADFDADANRLRRENPKLASILNQARKLGQSEGKFMAVAPDGVANVNLTADEPDQKTLAEVVAASRAALTDFGGTNFAEEPATLAGQPATKLAFRLPVQTDDGVIPTDEIQYYMLKGKKAYILTVAAAPADVASTIAGSLALR
ncbi:MAG TPA: hypothetical protein VM388_08235 [Acidimicrobiales bacterium]|nr:hypothetical protein [Acidimicrobiales bacterium]